MLGLLWLSVAFIVIVIVWHILRNPGIAFYTVESQYAQFGQAFPILMLVPPVPLVRLPGLIQLGIRSPAKRTRNEVARPSSTAP